MTAPLLELSGITKSYGALRPLRIERLQLAPGDLVALLGLDQPAAEVLINLITGASLPDTGNVRIFGRESTDITDTTEWLPLLDRFGIVSERAALLEPMTAIQNLAMPFSLEIEPPPPDIERQASSLAVEAGLHQSQWQARVGELDSAARMRLRLGRALAFNPGVLILEHASATIPRPEVVPLAVSVRRISEARGLATLNITADAEFAGAVARHVFALEPATGRLRRL